MRGSGERNDEIRRCANVLDGIPLAYDEPMRPLNAPPVPHRAASRSHARWERRRRRKVTAPQGSGFPWRLVFGGAVPLVLALAGGSEPTAQAEDTQPPMVTARSPAASATGVSTLVHVRVTFNEAVDPASVTLILRDSSNQTVPATFTYEAPTFTATLGPANDLNGNQTYTASLTGARDLAGNVMAGSVLWSFTTATPGLPGQGDHQRLRSADGRRVCLRWSSLRRRKKRPHQGLRQSGGSNSNHLCGPQNQCAQLLGSRPARHGAPPELSHDALCLRALYVRRGHRRDPAKVGHCRGHVRRMSQSAGRH